VIGAGAMGGDIAAWCALKDITVTLQDLAPERIAPGGGSARRPLQESAQASRTLCSGRWTGSYPEVAGQRRRRGADLIIEAIVENADVKRKLYASIEPRSEGRAPFLASNTLEHPAARSSPRCSSVPERLVACISFNPVAQMMLVEIVEGTADRAGVMMAGQAFAKQIDKLPLPCKSRPDSS
jgi:3-hydroxyacyl-CoA dehydrogenase/enoyl-CoA hydratase/3-hydroxybutyryl-CoA epimerase